MNLLTQISLVIPLLAGSGAGAKYYADNEYLAITWAQENQLTEVQDKIFEIEQDIKYGGSVPTQRNLEALDRLKKQERKLKQEMQ